MKKLNFALLIGGVTLILSSCGESCYSCSKDSYFNGISYTEPGPKAKYCQEENETNEQYETRIKEHISNGNTCSK